MKLNERSVNNLRGVHLDLVRVINHAAFLGQINFIVTEGVRSLERQKQLLANGKSRTLHSRHLTGHAVDLAVIEDGQAVWSWPKYEALSKLVKQAAEAEGVPIEWGGDWKTFKDGPHFQLPSETYPDGD